MYIAKLFILAFHIVLTFGLKGEIVKLTDAERQEIISSLNTFRANIKGGNMECLTEWDNGLEEKAASNAAKCTDSIVDEASGAAVVYLNGSSTRMADYMQELGEMKKRYEYGKNICNSTDGTDTVCNNYKQFVWWRGGKIGCSKAICRALPAAVSSLLTCHFQWKASTGQPYSTGDVCSFCQGGYDCVSNLCCVRTDPSKGSSCGATPKSLVPLYRMVHKVRKDTVLTTSNSRKAQLLSSNYEDMGTFGYISDSENTGCSQLKPLVEMKAAAKIDYVYAVGEEAITLCSYHKAVLKPLTGLRQSFVKNNKHFCDEIKTLRIARNEIFVSYDVKDLFTNIPIPTTLGVLEDLLSKDATLAQRTRLNPFHLVKLVSFCMKEGNYFRFQDRFYAQNNGAPMGSSLSPILAEVFMEHFEQKAFANLGDSETPTFFKRYADDIFAIVKVGTAERFLEHLNSLFPDNIVLTFEKETNNMLPFLDALVIRRGTTIVTKVYRKATSSDRYLNFASHHHISIKTGIISTMVARAVSMCDLRYLISELSYIKRTFLANGYPRALITSVMKRRLQNPRRLTVNEEVPKPLIVLPYYHNIGEQIKRLGKTLNFRVYFKSSPYLRALLRTDKTKVPFDSIPGFVTVTLA
uniref:Reverse transcriptase domain-containing protein n=1 Tax=Trichuris muris TaxID=70415 RepID=A0A5S6QVG5_TRIMR